MQYLFKGLVCLFLMIQTSGVLAVNLSDTLNPTGWSTHFQLTAVAQKHAGFRSLYSGQNSLADTVEPAANSLTATLFLGHHLWKGAAFYFNPEISGGNGLSFASGVAGALNGETYRVGNVSPQPFIARAYVQQQFALGDHSRQQWVTDDVNRVPGALLASRITISAGKFAIADFYDDNSYGKDPRTQFLNWSLWANGAWDYPANTRGYTFGIVAELVKPGWVVRMSSVAVPRIANFHLMEYRFGKAHSETIEFEKQYRLYKRKGTVRVMASSTFSQAPSYQQGIEALATHDSFLLDVIQGKQEHKAYGGSKFGLGINIEQEISNTIGFFSRMGWNDGRHATWAFTEIDRTINAGLVVKGTGWRRRADRLGVAVGLNGISRDHRDFLKEGGYGFIIGDGTLNYGSEGIIEAFYNAQLNHFVWITADYQLVNNPGYNKVRGPVHVFGVRVHLEW